MGIQFLIRASGASGVPGRLGFSGIQFLIRAFGASGASGASRPLGNPVPNPGVWGIRGVSGARQGAASSAQRVITVPFAMAFQDGSALYSCFICGTKHKWFKMMISANPASQIKEDDEWPDNVALSRTDGTTEVLRSGRTDEALNAAVEGMSLNEAASSNRRGTKRRSASAGRRMLSMKVCLECELLWRKAVVAAHPEYTEWWAKWATEECVNFDHTKSRQGA